MGFDIVRHVKRVQSVHADQQDVVDIGGFSGRAKGHPGQQAEGDSFQSHGNIPPQMFCCGERGDCGSHIFHDDDRMIRSTDIPENIRLPNVVKRIAL